MNHYEVLGVPRDADATRIRRAYLAAARAHHPDFHAGAGDAERAVAARRMQEVNEAWAVLGDPSRRAGYDLGLERARSGDGDPGGTRAGPMSPPPGKGWTPRADDTGWQQDFAAWRDEDDRLGEDPPGTARRVLLTVPVALVVLGMLLGLTGAALASRGLIAAAFAVLALAAILFVMLPVFEMTRSRGRH